MSIAYTVGGCRRHDSPSISMVCSVRARRALWIDTLACILAKGWDSCQHEADTESEQSPDHPGRRRQSRRERHILLPAEGRRVHGNAQDGARARSLGNRTSYRYEIHVHAARTRKFSLRGEAIHKSILLA